MKIRNIEMKIVEVQIIPLAEGGIAPYKGSQDAVGTSTATSVVYKVTTEEGIVGWGEMNPVITLNISRMLLEEYIKPQLIGKDPFDLKRIMDTFHPVYNPQVNTKSFLSGVELALWDIMGKATGKPIYELLGGKVRDKVEIAYAFGMFGLEETRDKVRQVKERGYKTLKTKGGNDVQADIQRTIAMREAAGDDFSIRVDMNQGLDTLQALHYMRAVEDCQLQYVEQPIKVNQFDDMRMLRERTQTPLAVNEDCYVPGNLFEAIERGSVDAAVADMEPIGGIAELNKLAHLAEAAQLPLAHHCAWDMGIKLAGILHATCAMPAFSLPLDSTYHAHAEDVLATRIPIIDGCYLVPEGPGLGIEVDEEKLEFLSIESSPRFFV